MDIEEEKTLQSIKSAPISMGKGELRFSSVFSWVFLHSGQGLPASHSSSQSLSELC